MLDEETGFDPRVISASIADPYLLLIRDDSSAYVAQMDKNNELEEIEREDKALATAKWLSGCLYHDDSGLFAERADKEQKTGDAIIMFLLSAAGALYVSEPPPPWTPLRAHTKLRQDLSTAGSDEAHLCRPGCILHTSLPHIWLRCTERNSQGHAHRVIVR